MAHSSRPSDLNPLAAVLAWLWPGLGHMAIGERRRGRRIMLGVLFLFFSGLLIGGVDCVDRKNDRLWYLAQVLCGPLAIAADWANQTFVQSKLPTEWTRDLQLRERFESHDPEVLEPLRRVGLGRVNEMGTLFIALAGLMNLVVILDALCSRPAAALPARSGGGAP
jgi:hypothetical protein